MDKETTTIPGLIYLKLQDSSGVTLLEVLVALVLVGLLSALVLQLTGTSSRWLEDVAEVGQAGNLAVGLLEYYRADPARLYNGPLSGEGLKGFLFPDYTGDDPYRWELVYHPFAAEPLLLHLSVKVCWDVGIVEREVEMSTLIYQGP